MQTVRNPPENSPLPSKTAPKCNLAEVIKVRLRRSHFSTSQMLLVFPDSELRPSRESWSVITLPSLQVTVTVRLKVCSRFLSFLKDLTYYDKLEIFLVCFYSSLSWITCSSCSLFLLCKILKCQASIKQHPGQRLGFSTHQVSVTGMSLILSSV